MKNRSTFAGLLHPINYLTFQPHIVKYDHLESSSLIQQCHPTMRIVRIVSPCLFAPSNQLTSPAGFLGGVGNVVGKTVGGVTGTVGDAVGGLGKTVGGATQGLGQTVSGATEGLGNTAKGVGKSAGDTVSGVTGNKEGDKSEQQQ